MKYQIKNASGDVIAKFVNEFDRDYSLEALNEIFELSDVYALVKFDEE